MLTGQDCQDLAPLKINRSLLILATEMARCHARPQEEKEDVADDGSARAMRTGSFTGIKQSFEPLIGSSEAARLLGNIHVKTLQRYARHKRIPGYQIGGHWYFRASELDSWLRISDKFA